MRILWVTNSISPVLNKAIGLRDSYGGGWVFALAKQLSLDKGIKLCIATVYDGKEVKFYEIEGVEFYLLPSKSNKYYEKKLETYWETVYRGFKPDVIHIHGTEYMHGLALMRKYPNLNYAISVQGIVGVYARYFTGGISAWEIIRNITFRDIVRRDSIFQGKKRFENRGILEREYFQRSQHVIGRTGWDFAHSKTINPSITYHFCNESLRDRFYGSAKWDCNTKIPFTIFLSQSVYPIKGLHSVIKAIGILSNKYPDIQLRVAGPEILRNNNFRERIKVSGYGKYLIGLIKKYNLNNNVLFTGVLSEEQMVSEYLKANLFICPSSIENSPNSVGEAQILGVPTIASYVGGISDMIVNEESGLLYRFEEFEMLAFNIKRIFEDNRLASKLSENGRNIALKRHDRVRNAIKMVEIYEQIIKRK